MDLEALEKLAADPAQGAHAAYLAADVRRLLPQLADPARVEHAVATLQKWAGGADGTLRKAFAAEFLDRARTALGNNTVEGVVARHAMPVKPGAAVTQSSAVERFKQKPFLVADDQASGRLSAPMLSHTDADAAHRSGAQMAGRAAKHSFKLGLLAAGAAGTTASVHHALSDKQRAERSTAAKARWARLKNGPATPMQKIFGVHGHVMPNIPDSAIWQKGDGSDCPTCGKSWPRMAKADATLVAKPVPDAWTKDSGMPCPTCGADPSAGVEGNPAGLATEADIAGTANDPLKNYRDGTRIGRGVENQAFGKGAQVIDLSKGVRGASIQKIAATRQQPLRAQGGRGGGGV